MSYLTLEFAKYQLNIESGYTTDDKYIQHLINVSEEVINNFCDGKLSGYTGTTGATAMPVVILQATMLMVAHLYTNRTPIAFSNGVEIPYTVRFLVSKYLNYYIA